jgi:phosphoglycolate phosphatase-like HAD superfamily hydrolase
VAVSAAEHLVLFDVDGTLLRCGPQIGGIFVSALVEVFGGYLRPDGYNFAGRTDPQIVLDLVAALALPREDVLRRLPDMQRAYFHRLERELDRDRMELLPGVVPLLERLAAREDVALGLLTGNWHGSADIKLGRFDLGRFFPFGAFGDDAPVRRELVPIALERAAAAAGRPFTPAEVLIVGDSELDVDCARAAGIRPVAVTTGFTSAARLRAAGADWVFPDLEHAAREIALFREVVDHL